MSLVLLVYPIIIFAVVLVVVAIYKSIYRNNMNRALDGEGTEGMMDLGQFIKVIVFLSLIIMNIVALSKITSLENQLYSVQTNLSSMNTSLRNEIYSLNQQINEYFAEQALVQEFEYSLDNIDGEEALYHIEFTLKELDPNATVYLSIAGDLNEKIEIPSTTLTFDTNVTLQTNGVYTINLLIEGDTIKQEELLVLDVEEMLYEAVTANMYPDFWDEEDVEEGNYKEKLQVVVTNQLINIESRAIESVKFDVYYEGELFLEETLTTPTVWDPNTEVYKMYGEGVEVYSILFEDNDYRWSELKATCTITLIDGTVIIRDVYL